jgi:soluble lytic murein transglycosylase-like protein
MLLWRLIGALDSFKGRTNPQRESVAPMSLRHAPLSAGLCLALTFFGPLAGQAATKPVPDTARAVAAYSSVLREYNPLLPQWQSHDLARHLLASAWRYRIDANMLAAIVAVESSWRTHAVSYAGAIGLGQLMPGTAAGLGVNPRDPADNLSGAARYLRGLLQTFGSNPNRYELVFAAYNAGPKAVMRYGGIPPYYETQHYVFKVLRAWHTLQETVHVPIQRRVPESLLATAEEQDPDAGYWLNDGGIHR